MLRQDKWCIKHLTCHHRIRVSTEFTYRSLVPSWNLRTKVCKLKSFVIELKTLNHKRNLLLCKNRFQASQIQHSKSDDQRLELDMMPWCKCSIFHRRKDTVWVLMVPRKEIIPFKLGCMHVRCMHIHSAPSSCMIASLPGLTVSSLFFSVGQRLNELSQADCSHLLHLLQ